ncbi:MAG: hypothetical protein V3U51_06785 [Thermoplasmata archaeon]
MIKRKVVSWMVRGSVIFLISGGVMALFWFHELLYRYGLLSLFVFGGLGIAALIATISWLTRPYKSLRMRGKRSFYFPPEDLTKVVFGTISMISIPIDDEKPPGQGSLCVARVDRGKRTPFANFMIKDVNRAIVSDIEEEDLSRMGFSDIDELQTKAQESSVTLSDDLEVYLVEFEVLEKGRF